MTHNILFYLKGLPFKNQKLLDRLYVGLTVFHFVPAPVVYTVLSLLIRIW